MCAHFFGGSSSVNRTVCEIEQPHFHPGVTACLKQDDFAETCAQKSIFPLQAKSSTAGRATQLSLHLGHSDWPVKRSEPRSVSVIDISPVETICLHLAFFFKGGQRSCLHNSVPLGRASYARAFRCSHPNGAFFATLGLVPTRQVKRGKGHPDFSERPLFMPATTFPTNY
jgi:hypothetical protein